MQISNSHFLLLGPLLLCFFSSFKSPQPKFPIYFYKKKKTPIFSSSLCLYPAPLKIQLTASQSTLLLGKWAKIKINSKYPPSQNQVLRRSQALAPPSSAGALSLLGFPHTLQPRQAAAWGLRADAAPEPSQSLQEEVRRPSQPVPTYSCNKAWGQGQADTGNIIAAPAVIPSRGCGGLTIARGMFLPSRPQWVTLESAFSGSCSGSHGFRESLPPPLSGSRLSPGREAQGETLGRTGGARLFLKLPQQESKPFPAGS